MKLAKAFGLFVPVTAAAVALTAPSASAQATLCTNEVVHQDAELCEGSHGKHVKLISVKESLVVGTKAILTWTNASGATVRIMECSTSTTVNKVTDTVGGMQTESLIIGGCTLTGCSNVSISTPGTGKAFPWAATVSKTSGTDGLLHVTGLSLKFTATCFFITATCEWEATTATATIKGGTPATIEFNAVPLTRTAGAESICGTKADWTAKYTVTAPSSLFIT